MVEKILTAAGLPFRETRFQSPPKETYAVYNDEVEADGPDGINMLFTHEITVELYEPKPDNTAERAIEDALDAEGLHYEKQPRYWLQDQQRYQVVYEFTYIEKRSI